MGASASTHPAAKPYLLFPEGHELWVLPGLLHWPLHQSASCLGQPPTCVLLTLGGEPSLLGEECHSGGSLYQPPEKVLSGPRSQIL